VLLIPKRHGQTDGRTDRQTDRQTDGRLTVALPRSALASRGNDLYKSMDMHGVDTSSTELQSLESATHLYLLRCNIQGRLVIIHHAAVIYRYVHTAFLLCLLTVINACISHKATDLYISAFEKIKHVALTAPQV